MEGEELKNLGIDEDKQRVLYLRLKKKFEGSVQEEIKIMDSGSHTARWRP